MEAYLNYKKGFRKLNYPDSIDSGMQNLRNAINLDTSYALAYFRLGQAAEPSLHALAWYYLGDYCDYDITSEEESHYYFLRRAEMMSRRTGLNDVNRSQYWYSRGYIYSQLGIIFEKSNQL